MKRILCLLFCVIGCVSTAFWMATYILHYNKDIIPAFMTAIMWISAIVIFLALIIGFGFIKITVNQWFPDGDSDKLAMKDRVLVVIVFLISVVCIGAFVLTIICNNINAVNVTEVDNMKLRFLLLTIANSYMAFAYYQHFQVLK